MHSMVSTSVLCSSSRPSHQTALNSPMDVSMNLSNPIPEAAKNYCLFHLINDSELTKIVYLSEEKIKLFLDNIDNLHNSPVLLKIQQEMETDLVQTRRSKPIFTQLEILHYGILNDIFSFPNYTARPIFLIGSRRSKDALSVSRMKAHLAKYYNNHV